MDWKGSGRKRLWPNRDIPGICLEGLRKTMQRKDKVIALKTYGGVDEQIHVLLTSTLVGGEL
jgi:hypothetical protein